MLRLKTLVERVRQSLWLIPSVAVVLAVVLHRVLTDVDRTLDTNGGRFVFGGGADSARSFLTAISTSTLSMTVLVFSVTMLVLQLASSQLSPRVLRTFLRDLQNQVILGIFVGTYTYALLVLREVRDDSVPGISVWVAFVLMLASIGGFILFIHHIAQSIRVSSIVARIGRETRGTIEHLYPHSFAEPAPEEDTAERLTGEPSRRVRWRGRSGVVVVVSEDELLRIAEESRCTLALVPAPGDFVGRGSVIVEVWGDADDLDEDCFDRVLAVGAERSMQQDAAFGMRQLVDIAERALSAGVNDPTTAVQVLDQLHDILLVLLERQVPSPWRATEEHGVGLYLPRPDWDEYVALALDEIRIYAIGSLQVMRRMRFLLNDLVERAPLARQAVLHEQLRLLDAAIDERFTGVEREVARRPDAQGHGAAPRRTL